MGILTCNSNRMAPEDRGVTGGDLVSMSTATIAMQQVVLAADGGASWQFGLAMGMVVSGGPGAQGHICAASAG